MDSMHELERRLDPAETMARLHEQLADDARAASASRFTSPAELPPVRVGLTYAEARRFDVCRALALAERGELAKAGGFEWEVAREMAALMPDKEPVAHRLYLPREVWCRDLAVGTGTAGGNFVGVDVIAPRDTLFPGSAVIQLGAQVLPGLRGNTVAPRFGAVATGGWLANEQAAVTESSSTPTTPAYTMAPKNFAAYCEISRPMLRMTTIADAILRHFRRVGEAALDAAALVGSGASGQPLGLANWSGVGTVTGASLGVAGALEFQTDTAAVGDPQRFGYATHPTTATLLAQRAAVANATPLWSGPVVGPGATMAGRPAFSTVNCAATTLIGGDFNELAIGEFGPGAVVDFNPYANFPAGIVGARLWLSVDIAVLTPAAFSVATSVT
jgi:HK97 family phage major capsid protein